MDTGVLGYMDKNNGSYDRHRYFLVFFTTKLMIKSSPSSPEEFRAKQFKMDKKAGTGAPSGAAFSRAKPAD